MKNVIILIGIVLLSACNIKDEVVALELSEDAETVWVFSQFNVPDEEGLESYYYYGRVSAALVEKISANKLQTGFILLKDVRYWSNKDERIHAYKDSEHTGELIFRIENISRIKMLAKEPKNEEKALVENVEPLSNEVEDKKLPVEGEVVN